MLATSKQLHNFVKSIADITGNAWGRRTWTDKRKTKGAKPNERYITFKFGSVSEADMVAEQLETLYKLTGITAKVTRTSARDYYTGGNSGEYVRTIGTV